MSAIYKYNNNLYHLDGSKLVHELTIPPATFRYLQAMGDLVTIGVDHVCNGTIDGIQNNEKTSYDK